MPDSSPRAVDLHLHEEVLLLALNDQKGTAEGAYLPALAAAILTELMIGGHVTVEGKTLLVTPGRRQRIDDPILRACRNDILAANRRRPLQRWLNTFAHLSDLKHRVAQGLCDRGILRQDEDRVLWVFRRKVYPERNPQPERELIARLRRAIFTETGNVTPETVALLSILKATGLLQRTFDAKKLRTRKKRVERLVAGEIMGKAAADAIAATQAMLMASGAMNMMMMNVAFQN